MLKGSTVCASYFFHVLHVSGSLVLGCFECGLLLLNLIPQSAKYSLHLPTRLTTLHLLCYTLYLSSLFSLMVQFYLSLHNTQKYVSCWKKLASLLPLETFCDG